MKKHITGRLQAAAIAAGMVQLSACSVNLNPVTWWSGPEERVPERLAGVTRYQCDAGKILEVRYAADGQSAMIIFPEREFRLDRASAASGAPYTNGRTTLSSKGDEAFLEENKTVTFANCKQTK